jgi:hypothetical protein
VFRVSGDVLTLRTPLGERNIELRTATGMRPVDACCPHRLATAYCRGLLDNKPSLLPYAAARYGEAGPPFLRAKALEVGQLSGGEDRSTRLPRYSRVGSSTMNTILIGLNGLLGPTRLISKTGQDGRRLQGVMGQGNLGHTNRPQSAATNQP